jgi:voltage-gated potassium channel
MTSITLTTVGYSEVLTDMGAGTRIFTMILMWSGMGVTLYAVSTVTAFVVERHLGRYWRERKMAKKIENLKGHVIICGAGKTGLYIAREFHTTQSPCCIIDSDPERVELARKRFPEAAIVQGDATVDTTLELAGVTRAKGVIVGLGEDSRNLLVTVTTRFKYPKIKIVARVEDDKLAPKFRHAGADYVVNPSFIGGMRMASEMLRPHVVTFLDRMLRGSSPTTRVEEVTVEAGSPVAGTRLGAANLLEQTGLHPIAVLPAGETEYTYNPKSDLILEAGTVMIVIGKRDQLDSLERLCEGRAEKVGPE